MVYKFYLSTKGEPPEKRQPCLTQCCRISRWQVGLQQPPVMTTGISLMDRGGTRLTREVETGNLKILLYCLNSSNEHALLLQFNSRAKNIASRFEI